MIERFVWGTCVRCNRSRFRGKRDTVRTWATATAPGNCSDRAATADTAVTPLPPGHTFPVPDSLLTLKAVFDPTDHALDDEANVERGYLSGMHFPQCGENTNTTTALI